MPFFDFTLNHISSLNKTMSHIMTNEGVRRERARMCQVLSGNLLPFRHQNDNHRKVEWKSTKLIEQCQRRFTSFVGVI